MANDTNERLTQLGAERVALEETIRGEQLNEASIEAHERTYARMQRDLGQLFRSAAGDSERTAIMVEMVRIMENRLVYLQNFIVEPTADGRTLANAVERFLDQVSGSGRIPLTALELTYFRGIIALYSGDVAKARASFQAACESEESDEANDIKYKSYVVLGNLSHEAKDYAGARDMTDQAMRYSQHGNVTAQALALKALNSYALKDFDEALSLFDQAIALFDTSGPYFNGYFYRNSLLFCGLIHFERRDYARAERYYSEVLGSLEPASYDHFDALSQLGRIAYATGRYDDAVERFRAAIEQQKQNENEYLVDTYFWLARTHLRKNERSEAKELLEKIARSEVRYERKSQAMQLLASVS